jgi:hypothetical protein
MVYDAQNCWVFGLCPSPGILGTNKHNVSEIGICFRPQVRGESPTLLGPLERTNLSHKVQSPAILNSFYQYTMKSRISI